MPAVNISSHGTTAMPPLSSNNVVPGQVEPSPRVMVQYDDHSHAQRLFVGPMPMKVAAPVAAEKDGQGKAKHWWLTARDKARVDSTDEEDDEEDEVPEEHAFRYFQQLGGREGEWEAQERLRKRTKREMLRRWKQSGWDSISHRHNKGDVQPKKWVGKTFQIGTDFLGVPMQTAEDARSSKSRSSKSVKSPDPIPSPEASTSRTFSAASYHTARVDRSQSPSGESSAHSSSSGRDHSGSGLVDGSGVALLPKDRSSARRRTMSLPRLLSASSVTTKATTDGQIRSPKALSDNGDTSRIVASDIYVYTPAASNATPLRSALRRFREDDARGKAVQFSPVMQRHELPVHPSEVLSRRPSRNPDTSDGAAAAQVQAAAARGESVRYGDIFLSDRMLVRRSHAKSGNIGPYFDAGEAMKLRDLRSYEWKEYLVVWRKGQLELYEDYSIPGKEMILGHKHLAHVIPLQKPDTNLSLYSFTDLTFCLACTTLHVTQDKTRTASSLSARIHFRRGSGTDIFVFKGKTRSGSIDWMWNLWRWLDNGVPRSFDVYCPATENRVRLQVPEFDQAGGEGYKVFTRDHVVELCRAALKHLPSWDYLIEGPLSRGASLELCWRNEAMLDWVRWRKDSDGNTRDWEVIYGLCLGKPHEITHLEARIAEHRPISVILSDGTHLREPPGVEGYLYRIKPFSQSRAQVYISTHSGCLFLSNAGRAKPPRPPIPIKDDNVEDDDSIPFQELEVRRGTIQILQADVFIDLRSIVAVRRAFQVTVPSQPLNSQNGESYTRERADDEDEGGDEVMSRHPDKSKLKMRRSFELLMRTGNVIRFEAYSCAVALEWIAHLTHLVEYWKYRHRIDARQEMELLRAVTGNPPVVLASPDKESFPERPPDYDQSSEYLPRFWNWCVLDGCLSVLKNGRLYLRRGSRGQYRLMQLVLVSGHLIQFHITHGTAHHLRSKTTSLFDAYVCSGHFAIQALPPMDEFSATRDPLPRRFQDGLENDDPESDKVLLIWYRPQAIGKANAQREQSKNSSETTILPLNSKRKVLVLKARSRLERNAWCWALNAEVERISRRHSNCQAKKQVARLIKT